MRIFIFLLVFTAVSCGVSEQKKDVKESSSVESVELNSNAKIDTMVLVVEGMTCTGCEQTVEKTVLALPGIKSVEASHIEKMATIQFVEGAVEKDKVVKAIKGAGYEVVE